MSGRNLIPELRARAEQQLGSRSAVEGIRQVDPARLVHELQVHQVELEMQNEALVAALEEADLLRMKYHQLYDFGPVAYLTLNSKGDILEANLETTKMLGLNRGKLLNRRLQDFFDPSALPQIRQFFASLSESTQKVSVKSLLLFDILPIPHYVDVQGIAYVDVATHEKKLRLVMMDVTALKLATDDVVKAISQFGELN